MNVRAKWMFSFLILAIMTILILLALMQENVKSALALQTVPDLGMGTGLNKLVENLEKEIRERNAFEITTKNNPLRLHLILPSLTHKTPAKPRPVHKAMLRLVSTILTPEESTAVINYNGRHYNRTPGQRIAGYRVLEMGFDKVILENESSRLVLTEKPLFIQESRLKKLEKSQLDTLQL